MKTPSKGKALFILTALASFVYFLCASVSQILPLIFIIVLAVCPMVSVVLPSSTFTEIKQYIQKTE